MARTHLDATHCLHCGKTHARGIYLVTHLLESEGTWRLGRFCTHRCVELMIQVLDGEGVDIPDSLVAEPIVEAGYDETAYEQMMRCLDIIEEELPHSAILEKLMRSCAMPCRACEIGIDDRTLKLTFLATKDVRGKYIASRLLWDLGLLESFAEDLGREDLEDSGLSSSKPLAHGR